MRREIHRYTDATGRKSSGKVEISAFNEPSCSKGTVCFHLLIHISNHFTQGGKKIPPKVYGDKALQCLCVKTTFKKKKKIQDIHVLTQETEQQRDAAAILISAVHSTFANAVVLRERVRGSGSAWSVLLTHAHVDTTQARGLQLTFCKIHIVNITIRSPISITCDTG